MASENSLYSRGSDKIATHKGLILAEYGGQAVNSRDKMSHT